MVENNRAQGRVEHVVKRPGQAVERGTKRLFPLSEAALLRVSELTFHSPSNPGGGSMWRNL